MWYFQKSVNFEESFLRKVSIPSWICEWLRQGEVKITKKRKLWTSQLTEDVHKFLEKKLNLPVLSNCGQILVKLTPNWQKLDLKSLNFEVRRDLQSNRNSTSAQPKFDWRWARVIHGMLNLHQTSNGQLPIWGFLAKFRSNPYYAHGRPMFGGLNWTFSDFGLLTEKYWNLSEIFRRSSHDTIRGVTKRRKKHLKWSWKTLKDS